MKSFNSIPALFYLAVLAALLGGATTSCTAFQPARRLPTHQRAATTGFRGNDHHQNDHNNHNSGYYSFGGPDTTAPNTRCDRSVRLSAGFLDDIQGFFKRFTTRASASHILIKVSAAIPPQSTVSILFPPINPSV